MRYQQLGYDLSAIAWVPVASFTGHTFFASCGILTLPFLLVAEVMPERVRSTGISMCMMLLYALDVMLMQGFPVMLVGVGVANTLFVFAASTLAAVLFVIGVVPETNGRSLEAIRRLMVK